MRSPGYRNNWCLEILHYGHRVRFSQEEDWCTWVLWRGETLGDRIVMHKGYSWWSPT